MLKLETNLLKYLPVWYRQILDYQELCLTESEQFEALALAVNAIGDNFFFQTADEQTIALWEQVLDIVPNPITETLAFRRARVINRLSTKPPFTLGFLYRKLDELIGPGAWTVTVDYSNYTLYIESSAQDQSYYSELAYTIGRIKPAHIVFVNRPLVTSPIELTETIEYQRKQYYYILGQWQLGLHPFATDYYTYNYKLGSWPLGSYPFATETPGSWEVVKLPSIKSIQPALKTQTASFIAGDVAQARINGSLIIPGVQSHIENGAAIITYAVTQSMVKAVTQAELLDKDGNVLTSSFIYVPVQDVVELKHTIPVKEGDA